MKTPILFIVFNRPYETKKVFEAIKLAQPEKLYISADGPRLNNKNDDLKCREVKDIFVSQINWTCKVETNFRNQNLGCRLAVSSAIDWFFENEEEGIILEDDTLPEKSFFPFCEELLYKYRNDSRIGIISGDNFGFGFKRNNDSYYYTKYTHIWGWASWRRSWMGYDHNMKDYTQFLEEDRLNDIFPDLIERIFWKENFDKVTQNNFDTWDFQLVYHNFKNNKLNIMPSINLVTNIGFNKDATHTTLDSPYSNMETEIMKFPLIHPRFIIEDTILSEKSRDTFLSKESPKTIKNSVIKKILKKIF